MINSPWSFRSSNYHFAIDTAVQQQLSNLILPPYVKLPKTIDGAHFGVVFTVSDVLSTFDGEDFIHYHEVLFKYILRYGDEKYFFPLVTYVDHEYSLIRGFFLGFQKYFAKIDVAEGRLIVTTEVGSLTIETTLGEATDVKFGAPFLLERNYDLGDGVKKRDRITLVTENYRLLNQREFTYSMEDDGFLKTHGVDCGLFNKVGCYTEDQFSLVGVKVL